MKGRSSAPQRRMDGKPENWRPGEKPARLPQRLNQRPNNQSKYRLAHATKHVAASPRNHINVRFHSPPHARRVSPPPRARDPSCQGLDGNPAVFLDPRKHFTDKVLCCCMGWHHFPSFPISLSPPPPHCPQAERDAALRRRLEYLLTTPSSSRIFAAFQALKAGAEGSGKEGGGQGRSSPQEGARPTPEDPAALPCFYALHPLRVVGGRGVRLLQDRPLVPGPRQVPRRPLQCASPLSWALGSDSDCVDNGCGGCVGSWRSCGRVGSAPPIRTPSIRERLPASHMPPSPPPPRRSSGDDGYRRPLPCPGAAGPSHQHHFPSQGSR